MKFRIALPLFLVARTGAHAQSSVTLYGIVDLGISYANSVQTGNIHGRQNGC